MHGEQCQPVGQRIGKTMSRLRRTHVIGEGPAPRHNDHRALSPENGFKNAPKITRFKEAPANLQDQEPVHHAPRAR
jgi:hypothetical protein